MAKMSIYIPDELKERMDGRPHDNWSSIAQRAFEMQINSTLKGGSDMTAVIERLRASKAKGEERERPQWTADGRTWASEDAEYDQLKRVGSIDPDLGEEETLLPLLGKAFSDDQYARLEDQVALACVILTGDENDFPSPSQVRWFIEGAQEIWEEVKDEI